MGPLDRYAFRVTISLFLHTMLTIVSAIAGAVLASANPVAAAVFGLGAAINAVLALRATQQLRPRRRFN